MKPFFFRQHFETAVFSHRFDVLKLFDRFLNSLIVGQKTAKPAIINVVLPAAFCFFADGILCLSLCSDKKDLLIRTFRERFLNVAKCITEELLRLLKIDNIEPLRSPKMYSSSSGSNAVPGDQNEPLLQEFFHRYCSQTFIS